MRSTLVLRSALIVLLIGAFTATLSAQKVEIYPHAGGFWPEKMDDGNRIKKEAVYGVKGGVFVTPNSQLEGSFGYMNHFELKNPANAFNPSFGITGPTVHAFMYDLNGAYNFGQRQFLNARVAPYVSLGVGGLTADVRNAPEAFIQGGGNIRDANGNVVPNPARTIRMDSGDTFLTFNYGGGLKAMNVWGPVGLRADFRGRTLPNFYGDTMTWPELTGGITFTWGER